MTSHFRYVVYGRVQGVGFRAWVRQEATRLNLAGWTANLPDGRVEVVVNGSADAVAALRMRLLEGPPAARVTGVEGGVLDPDSVGTAPTPIRFVIR